jgi:hypothetical protein
MNVKIENFIGIFEDAFTKEYCDSAIKYFEDMKESGFTLNRQKNEKFTKAQKDDAQFFAQEEMSIVHTRELARTFNEVFWNEAYLAYSDTFDVLKSSGTHSNYAFKMQKTCIGQGYHIWHFENDARHTSNRLFAWMVYLNDVEEGGETEFLYYPKRIKPKAGTLLLWPASFTHTHRGNPPISNDKYVITGWVEY